MQVSPLTRYALMNCALGFVLVLPGCSELAPFGPMEDSTAPYLAAAPGNGKGPPVALPPMAQVAQSGRFTSISVGETHACGLTSSGDAYCWGANFAGQLGAPSAASCAGEMGLSGACSASMVKVTGGHSFRSIAAGSSHTCGVTTVGNVLCWGGNTAGQLGNGGTLSSAVPVQVTSSLRFVSADASWRNSCAVTVDGDVWCWGSNSMGQLGGPAAGVCLGTPCSTTPVQVSLPFSNDQVSVGLVHACARATHGATYCWGSNQYGQLGIGSFGGTHVPPSLMEGGGRASVSAGALHSCVIANFSAVAFCGGSPNQTGALGVGFHEPYPYPAGVAGGMQWSQVSASDANYAMTHTCGVTTSDEAYCWGANNGGQLGVTVAPAQCSITVGSFHEDFDCALEPVAVSGGLTFASVGTGRAFSCGLRRNGNVYCWGHNHWGQLGDGTTTNRSMPVRVRGS